MANADRCVCCGEIIPEGTMDCHNCLVVSKKQDKRLIDANDALEVLCNYCGVEGCCPEGGCAEYQKISKLPTVDAEPVVHGRWEKAYITGYLKCNCCEDAFIYEEWLKNGKWNYCPNRGAKMDKNENP